MLSTNCGDAVIFNGQGPCANKYAVQICKSYTYVLGLSDTTVLAIYRDILKVSISRYFVINYRDTMPIHYCH